MFFNAQNRFLETFEPKRSYSRFRQNDLYFLTLNLANPFLRITMS